MIVVPNKKLVVRSQYGLMESSLCGRQPLRLSLISLKEGPSEGFDSFDVCLWLVHPTNQLFHSTSFAVIWLFPTTEVSKSLQDRSAGVIKLIPTSGFSLSRETPNNICSGQRMKSGSAAVLVGPRASAIDFKLITLRLLPVPVTKQEF